MTDISVFQDDSDEQETAPETADETPVDGVDQNWNSGNDWPGDEYNQIPIPSDRPMPKWDTAERRAWLLGKLKKYGTWRNVPMHQVDVADDFRVTQQTISNDLKELRKYIRFHAGDRAISMTEMVAQRSVAELMEEEDYFKALQAQLDYNEFLFELGRLERAPDKKEVQSVNVEAKASDLSDEERQHFDSLAEKLQQGQDAQADVIDVESTEVDDDDS